MKFNKFNWERNEPALVISEASFQAIVSKAFPNKTIESYQLVNFGLANTNIKFKLKESEEFYLLRVYTRDKYSLALELALNEQYGKEIPMPNFVYSDNPGLGFSFAITKWIPGKHLFELFETANDSQMKTMASSVAKTLANISKNAFEKSGFFKPNLEIAPFESEEHEHPFISYIKDCLEGNAGKWLGESLKDKLWKCILDNQDLFPPLEPSCLVHGDFNPDNIIIDENSFEVAVLLDWEFAFSGSYLFDIGTLFRFDVPSLFEETFITAYEEYSNRKLPQDWKKRVKIQDLSNLVGLLNTSRNRPTLIQDIKQLIDETLLSL